MLPCNAQDVFIGKLGWHMPHHTRSNARIVMRHVHSAAHALFIALIAYIGKVHLALKINQNISLCLLCHGCLSGTICRQPLATPAAACCRASLPLLGTRNTGTGMSRV